MAWWLLEKNADELPGKKYVWTISNGGMVVEVTLMIRRPLIDSLYERYLTMQCAPYPTTSLSSRMATGATQNAGY